jgi:hypothetical protein
MMDQGKIMTIYRLFQKVGPIHLREIMGLLTAPPESIMASLVTLKVHHHPGIKLLLMALHTAKDSFPLLLLIILKVHHHPGITVLLMALHTAKDSLPLLLLIILKDHHHQGITVLPMDLLTAKDSLPLLQDITAVLPVDHLDMPFLDFQDDAVSNINCH